MKKIALIVEGKGDVKALPSLVARAAAAFDMQVFACDRPILAGEAKKLRRTGELERHLRLAASRADADEICVIVDLDDGCPAEFSLEFNNRAAPISLELDKPIHICFCVREFECWFLSDLESVSKANPEFGITPPEKRQDPESVRGAKELLRSYCKNKKYKQMNDQLRFAKSLNIHSLALNNRSFRKFLKSITGLNYRSIIEECRSKIAA